MTPRAFDKISAGLNEAEIVSTAIATALVNDRARTRAILTKWRRADHMRLHAGEMTEQEVRTVRAVLDVVAAEIGRGP